MSTVDLGQYAQWYNFATSEQMMELTGMDPYDEDVKEILASYGLNYVGWAVAKDEYSDILMDDDLEYCLVAQDPETQKIDLYEWVGERLYPAIDDIMSIDFDEYDDEDMIYECADMRAMLKEAFSLQEALINPEDVEDMDDMDLEEFLQDNLNDAEQEVLEKLGLYLEPNGYGSMGTFVIYDNDNNELAEIPFEDYTDNELNIAYECDTIKQYQKKYESWVKKVTKRSKSKNKAPLVESTLSNIKQSQAVWNWYKNHYEPYQIQDFIDFISDELDVPPDKFAKIIIDGLSDYEKARILEFD